MLVAQVSAQQAVSVPSEAEKALRLRVEQFYQLQMDKKYRAAEAFVAEDTKDWYFASRKTELQGFTVQKVEMLEGSNRAKVSVKTKSSMMMIGVGRLPIEVPVDTTWKIESGEWVWYVDTKAPLPTPFGNMNTGVAAEGTTPPDVKSIVAAVDVTAFQHQVTIDKNAVTLTAKEPSATVTVTNGMPGYVNVTLEPGRISGITAQLDRERVGAGEKALISIQRAGSEQNRSEGTIRVSVAPLGVTLDVQVQSK